MLKVPRVAIVAARPVSEHLELFQSICAQSQPTQPHSVACFSQQGQVLIQLDQSQQFRVDQA